MATLRWLRTGSGPRGAPAERLRRSPLALLVLAVAGLMQSGCQSNPCGSTYVGPCNFFRQMREGIFRPRAAAANGCCGSEVIGGEAPIIESGGAPAAVVAPGAIVPGAPLKTEPSDLRTAPPDNSSSNARPATGRTSYEVSRPRENSGRAITRSLDSTPEPATRSAQGTRSDTSDGLDALSLEKLPPIDVTLPPPEPTDARADAAPAASTPKPPATSANSTTPTPEAPPSAAALPPAADAAPGLRRFASTEPKLAGGSLPTAAGLDWLADKGYKTLLDLREISDVQLSFIAEVTNRGMRYVALPISAKTLDADHIARFQAEISLAEGRPLYFCDTDGARAGAMWYVRRIAVDKSDPQSARREATEIGLTDDAFLSAATAYLERAKAPKAADADASPGIAPTAAAGDATAPSASVEPAPDRTGALADSEVETVPVATASPAAVTGAHDPTAWRSFAALIITGLTAPLAYIGGSALPTFRARKRASLPAPERQSKSLPGASGG